MYVLGISAYYHDSAAVLLKNGKIVAAAQEERFSRKKQDSAFPRKSIEYCLRQQDIELEKVEAICFYDKPFLTFERLLETYLSFSPQSYFQFISVIPLWLKKKIFIKGNIKKALSKISNLKIKDLPPLYFTYHHQSHAASAFFASPFEKASVLCIDGVGEWATTSVWQGKENQLKPEWEIQFPHSLGLLYSAFTYYLGFKVNSGEYKVMGLAPYGEPKYSKLIKQNLIDVKDDGTFRLDMKYFSYASSRYMINKKFIKLMGQPRRDEEADILQFHMDIAASIQEVIEDVVLKIAKTIKNELHDDNLCLAGGVALNCVANGKIRNSGLFKNIWVQPVAGDAGGALGAAYSYWFEFKKLPRKDDAEDQMQGSYWGPSYESSEIESFLNDLNVDCQRFTSEKLAEKIAELISQEKVIGLFRGRMEYGPRALGNRSILGDPRSKAMQKIMNLKIKNRESFRPFAPSILEEFVDDVFYETKPSRYMLFTTQLKDKWKLDPLKPQFTNSIGLKGLSSLNSKIPAITHVNGSARIQTVNKDINPFYHKVISQFYNKTGCPLVINTSFNVRGEPIVCNYKDAWECFISTGMDYLILEDFIISKEENKYFQVEQRQWELD